MKKITLLLSFVAFLTFCSCNSTKTEDKTVTDSTKVVKVDTIKTPIVAPTVTPAPVKK